MKRLDSSGGEEYWRGVTDGREYEKPDTRIERLSKLAQLGPINQQAAKMEVQALLMEAHLLEVGAKKVAWELAMEEGEALEKRHFWIDAPVTVDESFRVIAVGGGQPQSAEVLRALVDEADQNARESS